jgi:hypothetical protein
MPESEGPKRYESELTVAIDRSKLPPISTSMLTAEDDDRTDRETMVPCPACTPCRCCGGARMVSAAHAAELEPEPQP